MLMIYGPCQTLVCFMLTMPLLCSRVTCFPWALTEFRTFLWLLERGACKERSTHAFPTHAHTTLLSGRKSLAVNEINGATLVHTTCWAGSSFPLCRYTHSSDDGPMMNLYTAPMSRHRNAPFPSFPLLPAAAATATKQQSTSEGWKWQDSTAGSTEERLAWSKKVS